MTNVLRLYDWRDSNLQHYCYFKWKEFPDKTYICPVKPCTLILAIIVIVQSCMPCTDAFAMGSGNGKAEVSQSHGCQDPQDDLCSPFCQCGCCTGFAFMFHPSPAITPLPKVDPKHAEFYLSYIRSVSLPIWQPPQLIS